MPTRLERSTTNKAVAGVCGGIGEYLQVDPTLVRVFFVLGTIFTGGLGLLGYIVLVVLMPLPGQPAPFVKTAGVTTSTVEGAASSDPDAPAPTVAPPAAPRPADPEAAERNRAAFGIVADRARRDLPPQQCRPVPPRPVGPGVAARLHRDRRAAAGAASASMSARRSLSWPLILITIGLVFLLVNFGYIPGVTAIQLLNLWPLLLILAGVDIAIGRRWPLAALGIDVGVIALGLALLATQPTVFSGPFFFDHDAGGVGQRDVSVERRSVTSLSLDINGGAGRFRVSGGARCSSRRTARTRTCAYAALSSTRAARHADVRIDHSGSRRGVTDRRGDARGERHPH